MRQSLLGEETYLPPMAKGNLYFSEKKDEIDFIQRNLERGWTDYERTDPENIGLHLIAYNKETVFLVKWNGDFFESPIRGENGETLPMADPILWMEVDLI